jgi:chromosome segregation ATPase
MPGLVRNGRKRPSSEAPEDSSDSELPTPLSVGAKRARYARDASDSPTPSSAARHRPANGTSIEDVFQPGSIVRVKLKNFVTYTAAEFHLGPSLNMIIGPNGTGKSTLVCAICLGLGWSSEHLGRSKELSSFVKHGASEAEIEIELAKAEGERTNPVVTRTLRKEDNKTVFFINGKHSTKSAVMDMCKRFSIQIDNLCQFLPQDRVVEFAKMKDTERLRATLGAAAPAHMSDWHEQLKVLREEEKELEVKQHADTEHLKKLEALQNNTRGDVERWNQRQELATKAAALEKVRPIIQLRIRKQEFEQVKQDYEAAKQELVKLNQEVEPIKEAEKAAETYHNQVDQVVQRRRQMMNMVKQQADKKVQAIASEKKNVEEFEAQITGEMRDKQGRQQDIARVTKKITDLERKQQEQPVDYDHEAFRQQKEELRQQINMGDRQITELRSTMTSIQFKIQDWKTRKAGVKSQRERLDTQSGKQTNLLQKVSPETAKAWEWFEANKAELPLKGEVFGPPILTCSLTDSKYADAVESQLRLGDAVAITCTNNDDQRLLLRKMTHKEELGLHGIYLRTSPKQLSTFAAPVQNSGLAQFGFEGYLRDYITGPDPVIAMLCDNVKLNRIAFASNPITDQQHTAASNSPIQAWVSGREAYRITTRREYGVSSTSVNHLKRAQFFVDQPVNSDEKLQLDEQLRALEREGQDMVSQHNEAKAGVQQLTADGQAVREQRDEIVEKEKRIQRARAEWEALPRMIDQEKANLQQYLDLNSQTSDRIREIKAKSRQSSLKIATLTLEYAKSVTEFRRLHENVVEAEIRLIEAASEVRAFAKDNSQVLERLRARQVQLEELTAVRNNMKVSIRSEHVKVQEMIHSCTAEENEIIRSYKDLQSVAELDDEIQSVNARLEMMSAGDGSVVKTYENREVQIRKTQDSLEGHATALQEVQANIAEIKGPFVEQLDELMNKISAAFAHNFEQIGCAGEVSVYKDEDDFNAWSIQISVRFR